MFTLLIRWLPTWMVSMLYLHNGARFGDAVSYLFIGECSGLDTLLNRWDKWEQEYIRRGFRPISLDELIDIGGYGMSSDGLLNQKLDVGEEPISHALIYRNEYLGKVKPTLNMSKIMAGEIQNGTYVLPSTKK